MKKTGKVIFIFMLCFTLIGCSNGKKELKETEVNEAISEKYEIKNDVLTSTNTLLRVQIIFDDDNKVTYSPSIESLSYQNPKIQDVDATITLYNKNDKYTIIEKMEENDVNILEEFVQTLHEDMTIQQFTTWCLEKGKEEAKKHEEKQASLPDSNSIISNIEKKGYTVKKSTAGITIKDKTQMIVIKNGVIGVYDNDYDFISGNGLLYLPQNDAASKQVNKDASFIYQFSSNSFIQGEGSLEEYARIKEMKVEYDAFILSCGVSQEELATLK